MQIRHTLLGETLSGESDKFLEKWRNFRPTNSFARWKFRPTKSFARRKISPIRIFCTKVSSVLNGPLLVLSREVLWKWLVYLCDSWYTQNSLKLEGTYSSDKSDDFENLPRFVFEAQYLLPIIPSRKFINVKGPKRGIKN